MKELETIRDYIGWDAFVERVEKLISDLLPMIKKYYEAYDKMKDSDFDDGECFVDRHEQVQNIFQTLEEVLK